MKNKFTMFIYLCLAAILASCIGEVPQITLNDLESSSNNSTSTDSSNSIDQDQTIEVTDPESSDSKAPTATTQIASSVTSTSAKVSAMTNNHELDSQVWFEYGIIPKVYTKETLREVIIGSISDLSVSATLINLSPNTKYYFRVAVQSASGISYGSEMSFKTIAAGAAGISKLWGYSGELWDPKGRLQDFSYAGYHAGEKMIPNLSVVKNVKTDFGAKGDGTTDDTVAFKNAIAGTSQGALYVPPGRYLIKDRLAIKKSNFVLRGSGQSQTTLYFPKSLEEILGLNVAWKWGGGGLIWVGYTYEDPGIAAAGTVLTKVIASALKGENVLSVSNSSALVAGQIILLKQEDQGTNLSLWAHLHDGLIAPDPAYGRGIIYWPVEIEAVTSGKITLAQPLRFDVRLEWLPVVQKFIPSVQETGIENLTIEFPDIPYEGHQRNETGYNGFTFRGAINSWMRNVDIKNPDNGGSLDSLSKQVTLQNIRLISRSWKEGDYIFQGGYSGHHGISFGSHVHDNMLTDFEIVGAFIHDITVNHKNSGNVIRKGKGENINFDKVRPCIH